MTRPTTVLVLLTLTLVATVNTFTPLNDAPARSLVDEVFKKHGVNPAQVGVSARDSDSAPAKAKDSAPTPASAPAKAKDSASTPASPSAPASGPTSCSGSDSGSAQDDSFSQCVVARKCPWSKCWKPVKKLPVIGMTPTTEQPPPRPEVEFTIVSVTDARQKVKRGHYPEPKRGHYPERKPEKETINEPVLDYIYHLLVTLLVVFVGFGFRIRHLMAPQTTRERVGALLDEQVSSLPGYSQMTAEDIALWRECVITSHLAMEKV